MRIGTAHNLSLRCLPASRCARLHGFRQRMRGGLSTAPLKVLAALEGCSYLIGRPRLQPHGVLAPLTTKSPLSLARSVAAGCARWAERDHPLERPLHPVTALFDSHELRTPTDSAPDRIRRVVASAEETFTAGTARHMERTLRAARRWTVALRPRAGIGWPYQIELAGRLLSNSPRPWHRSERDPDATRTIAPPGHRLPRRQVPLCSVRPRKEERCS